MEEIVTSKESKPEKIIDPLDTGKKKKRGLTYKQKRFARAYIEANGNATEAVRRSYPNVKSEHSQCQMAHRLITQCPNVVEEIERLMNRQGLSVGDLTSALGDLVRDVDNPTARNQGIRTSLELLRLIGSNSHNVAVQVNIGDDVLARIRSCMADRRPKTVYSVDTVNSMPMSDSQLTTSQVDASTNKQANPSQPIDTSHDTDNS